MYICEVESELLIKNGEVYVYMVKLCYRLLYILSERWLDIIVVFRYVYGICLL